MGLAFHYTVCGTTFRAPTFCSSTKVELTHGQWISGVRGGAPLFILVACLRLSTGQIWVNRECTLQLPEDTARLQHKTMTILQQSMRD